MVKLRGVDERGAGCIGSVGGEVCVGGVFIVGDCIVLGG